MKLFRLIYIGFILARYRIDGLIFTTPWFYPFRCLHWLNPYAYFSQGLSEGERIRLALEKLGPIFIKFGQLLSTRRDLLPEEIANELSQLQDNVPPFSSKKARFLIEKSLKQPIDTLFSSFENEVLASASIAQVHAAVLKNGDQVVVKVLRPNVEKLIKRDLSLLKSMARFAQKNLANGQRMRPLDIINEFERSLNCELDLTQEAANADQLKENFMHSELVYIPTVYWDFCEKNVLVTERIEGIPVAKLPEERSDKHQLGENLIELFFTQVFRDNFFHADMHPGNIFVNFHKPQFILVDFGIAGSLSKLDQRYIAENLMAFFKRDYYRIAELHIQSGWLDKEVSTQDFAAAIRAISEPFFRKPLKDISIGILLLKLFQTARRFQINIQPQLILLQKNLLHVESLARQLAPELDLWKTAQPYLERWLKKQMGPRALLHKIYQNLPFWTEKLPELPDLIYQFLQKPSCNTCLVTPKKARRRTLPLFVLGMTFLASSALNFALAPEVAVSAWILFGLGGASTLLALIRS